MKKQIKDLKRRTLHNADAAYYVLSRARDNTYSRGVTSIERSPHSSTGISARRRSIRLSPVETSCTTAASPRARSAAIDRSRVGVFIAVIR